MPDTGQPERFRDRRIVFANGAVGLKLTIETATPLNYRQAISEPDAMPRTAIDGQLFLPPGAKRGEKLPAVVVVPGSLGIGVSHLAHAETLCGLGAAVLAIDPFGARGVTSTVANQTHYSFAASAYDVLAALKVLAARPEIDAARIGAQGHSRGGAAVMTAASRRFADPILGSGPRLRGAYGAYPWSGHQFLDPDIGETAVRAIIGDRDEWCSVQQVQGHIQAMRVRGGEASIRIVAGAGHSFDRDTPVETIQDASVAPSTPTAFVADDGSFVHPVEGRPDPGLVDRDLMVYGLKAGYGTKGAKIGGAPGTPDLFREDMVAFWRRVLW